MATFWQSSGAAPRSASVVIDGVPQTMTLDVGVAGQGNYFYSESAKSGCREYYFMFVDSAGTTHYYPGIHFNSLHCI
jgi:hypothetical protein